MKPLGKVKFDVWSSELAYAIGLIVTDGSLSIDGRHISFTSKDLDQILTFKKCLDLTNKIGKKSSGTSIEKKYHVIQFGDIVFYRFLNGIGIWPNKSKTIGEIKIPDEFFPDFLRGLHDGDGYSYSYWDPRWKSSFMFYMCFVSASEQHIKWLRVKLLSKLGIRGHINKSKNDACFHLKYAKNESIKLVNYMYYNPNVLCLKRKLLKIQTVLAIINQHNYV